MEHVITKHKMGDILNANEYPNEWVEALQDVVREDEINTLRRLYHFLAQLAAESRLNPELEENLNYRAETIRRVWPNRFPRVEDAQPLAKNPEALANEVYANRMGNGSPESGDGWRYRGRGLIQLTGKSNYARYGRLLGIDLVNEPELAADYAYSFRIAALYWRENGLNRFADQDDVLGLTAAINGSTRDANRRKQWLATVRSAFESNTLDHARWTRLDTIVGHDLSKQDAQHLVDGEPLEGVFVVSVRPPKVDIRRVL